MMYSKPFLIVQAAYIGLTMMLFVRITAQDLHPNNRYDNNFFISAHESKFLRSSNHPKVSRKAQTINIQWFATSYNDVTAPLGGTISFSNSGSHNVYIFDTENDYNNCDFSSATLVNPQTYTNSGSAEVVYFGCAIGAHCLAMNQKIKVIFEDATGAPTNPPTISPTPATTSSRNPTPSPASTGSPSMTKSSSNPPTMSPTPSPTPVTKTVDWALQSYEPIELATGSSIEFINQGTHDLLIMESLQKFQMCDFTGATMVNPQIYVNDGTEETVYFACSIGPHCGLGMKVAVVFGEEAPEDVGEVVLLPFLSVFAIFTTISFCLAGIF